MKEPRLRSMTVAVATGALLFCAGARSAGAQTWQFGATVFPVSALFTGNGLNRINNAGTMVGQSSQAGVRLYYPGGAVANLQGVFGSPSTWEVNNSGQVAGGTAYQNSNYALKWTNGLVSTVTTNSPFSTAYGINDLGDVTGAAGNHAFRTVNGVFNDLGQLGNYSQTWAINDLGQVAGVYRTAAGSQQALTSQGGQLVSLGALGGVNGGAYDLNDAGEIVGWGVVGGSGTAALYKGGAWQNLGYLNGDQGSTAFSISEGGIVSGNSFGVAPGGAYREHATLWLPTANGYVATSLESLVGQSEWTFQAGGSISDDGTWVTAMATNTRTGYRGIVAVNAVDDPEVEVPPVTATPEPATLALLATGLFGIAGLTRRRQR